MKDPIGGEDEESWEEKENKISAQRLCLERGEKFMSDISGEKYKSIALNIF